MENLHLKNLKKPNFKIWTYFVNENHSVILEAINKIQQVQDIPNYKHIKTKQFKQLTTQEFYIMIYHIYKENKL